jgi:hypothetical protein
MNRIICFAGGTAKFTFENLFFVLFSNGKDKIPLADRAAENIHE